MLAAHGLRVRSEARASARVVEVRLKADGPPTARTVFWLEPVPANAPVMVEDDADEVTPAVAEGGG